MNEKTSILFLSPSSPSNKCLICLPKIQELFINQCVPFSSMLNTKAEEFSCSILPSKASTLTLLGVLYNSSLSFPPPSPLFSSPLAPPQPSRTISKPPPNISLQNTQLKKIANTKFQEQLVTPVDNYPPHL